MKRLLVLTILLAVPPLAFSELQEAAVAQPLTLEDALMRARTTSARLASFQALNRAALDGVRGAEAGRRPDLDVQASYSRNSNVPELILTTPGAPPRTIFPNLPNQWRTHVGASLPIYTGGRVANQIESAKHTERATLADRDAAINDLVAETHIAYVSVLFARENARVLREAIASYEAHLKDARARQEMGLIASNEVLAVTVERERAELGRVQAENAAAIATANLRRLVGLPTAAEIELDPISSDPPAANSPTTTEALVEKASEGRAEIEGLRARIRSLEATTRVAQSSSKPQAGIQAGFDFSNPNPRILPLSGAWKDTWSVGLNVSWKILQAQTEALRAQLADLESRIRFDVTMRQLELESARAGKAVTRRGIEAAKDAVRIARDRYEEGVLSSSELLDAETRRLRAELDATQADAQIQIALAHLNRALGR